MKRSKITGEPILAIVEKDEASRKVASRTKTVARGIATPANPKVARAQGPEAGIWDKQACPLLLAERPQG